MAIKDGMKQRFTAKRLALMALSVALSFVVSFIEIPIIEPFKLDFGNVFILLIAFLLGPVEGAIVCILKECLRMIGGTVVGEFANMGITISFLLIPSILYQYKKGLKWVIPSLCAACVLATGVALLMNRYVNFPLYEEFLGVPAEVAFQNLFWVIVAFNLIKTVSVSVMTLLLYKRLSNFLKKWEK